MTDRLFEIESIPEVPLFREPRRSRGEHDARFRNEYPPDWDRCSTCEGTGRAWGEWALGAAVVSGETFEASERGIRKRDVSCPDCLGMGSWKAMVRLQAGHRCVRCHHPYVPKGDARMLGVEPTPFRWSPCDERCSHGGTIRLLNARFEEGRSWLDGNFDGPDLVVQAAPSGTLVTTVEHDGVEAEWRILTVHHLDGDKANCRWWNLMAACQRCHLEIQAKVVMERVYPHEHSEWFKPYVAGYYAHVYLGEELSRHEVLDRLEELLDLERLA